MIPYVNIAGQHRSLRDEILPAVERVLAQGDFIFGKEVGEFEQRFAELCEGSSLRIIETQSSLDLLLENLVFSLQEINLACEFFVEMA